MNKMNKIEEYEVEIYSNCWIATDGSDLFDESENKLSDYQADSLPEDLGRWWYNGFTEPPKQVRRTL